MLGCLAVCSQGFLGLITERFPRNIVFPDGNKKLMYVGIHISKEKFGEKWTSESPEVLGAFVGNVDKVIELLRKNDEKIR